MQKEHKFLLIALLLLPWLQAIPSLAASHDAGSPSGFLSDNLPVLADFDGDNKLDEATLSSDGALKTIHIAFGKSLSGALSFNSAVPDRGMLVSGDVDDDGDIDLVWIAADGTTFVICLGDGHGNFSINPDIKPDLRRILALFGNGKSRLADKGSGQYSQAVLLSTNLTVLRASGYNPDLSFQAFRIKAQAPAICASGFVVRQQRAPPSDFLLNASLL